MSRKSRAEADAAALASVSGDTSGDATVETPAAQNRRPTRRAMAAILHQLPPAETPTANGTATFAELNPLVVIPSPLNPRRGMDRDGLIELATSIVANGLLQPILVRPTSIDDSYVRVPGEDRWYEVICGARRLAAIDLALKDGRLSRDFRIPARVRECSDAELVILAATENLARADMHPLDEAEVFAAMRPHIKPTGEETTEAAIGKALGVSERTVFRRLALIKLAPELSTALREKQINLAQAQAFALGHHNDQRKYLKEIRERTDHNWLLDAHRIKQSMTEERIPVDKAFFDPALYTGPRIQDHDSGAEWFADAKEFSRLQGEAIKAKAEELAKSWKWVEIVPGIESLYDKYQTYDVRKTDKEAGCVIQMDRFHRVTIHAPALKKEVSQRREREKAAAERAKKGEPEPGNRNPLTQGQVLVIHTAKTQAMRRALAGDNRATLALACLGLLGEKEVHGQQLEDWQDRNNPIGSAPKEQAELSHLLRTAALALPADKRPTGNPRPKFRVVYGAGEEKAAADPAAWLEALLSLSDDDLGQLHRHLFAERIGTWANQYGGGWFGDSDVALAIAKTVDADRHLASTWSPDSEFFKAYGRERLVAIVRDQLHIRNADQLKKGELVALCMEQPKAFWQPELFPELRFQSNAEALQALTGPLPEPAGETLPAAAE